ncbi:unnamed protein product [marine sediment metagenome]|uniref:Uncharacterized protein n=1 Tax=marine sediment metagenome TaxID=412755 RepID=X1G648_9ZZZZ
MKYGLADMLKDALDAHDVHHDPKKILDDINPEIANIKPEWSSYSINCILFHLNYWQDLYIEMLKDKEIPMPEEPPSVLSWPSKEQRVELDYKNQLERFYQRIEIMKKLIEKVDYHKAVPSWGDAPKLKLIIIVLQHNSYHLSQIYTIKKSLME